MNRPLFALLASLVALQVSNTAHLRDLAASAARVFGWDNNDKPGVTFNQLCISAEQLEQIRQLRDDPFDKPAISEGGAISAITTEEVKQ